MKFKMFFIVLLVFNFVYSQNTFEYERSWGTYFGANGGQIAGVYTNKGVLFDSQKNLHLRGTVWNQQNTNNYYFDQFILGGGLPYPNQQSNLNSFEAKVSPSGTLSYYGYISSSNSTFLEKIDDADNKYYILYNASPAVQATAGVYFPNDPQPSSINKIILAKYSPSGALVWATYLPSVSRNLNIELDDANNLYVSGETAMVQNVATPGVFQENYDLIYDGSGNLIPSGYLLKLSPNGQRIWGTYTPFGMSASMQYHNGSLYMLTGSNTNPSLNTISTPGAFQISQSNSSITKINTATGTREWGTYYGPSVSGGLAILTNLAVNSTGLYITGTDYNYDGSSFFGTPASYKQYVTGGSDIFLSKFSLSGSREWSTYFGSSGEDMNEFDKVIALNDNDIYIAGNTYGMGNNIATTNAYQASPESNTPTSYNFYFAKFNSAGSLSWASYYGGSSSPAGIIIPINVAIDNNILYLYGSTNSNNGFTTEGAWMPLRNPSNTTDLTSFIAKFELKNNLGVSESSAVNHLVLYNNPNSGNFTIEGDVLGKKNCTLRLYDISGRLISTRKLNNDRRQYFELQSILSKGNYILEVSEHKTVLKTFKMIVK